MFHTPPEIATVPADPLTHGVGAGVGGGADSGWSSDAVTVEPGVTRPDEMPAIALPRMGAAPQSGTEVASTVVTAGRGWPVPDPDVVGRDSTRPSTGGVTQIVGTAGEAAGECAAATTRAPHAVDARPIARTAGTTKGRITI